MVSVYPSREPKSQLLRRPRPELVAAGATALVTLGLYIYTLAPSVSYGGDCGELITCAYTLGVAHPTGYPLYLMVGKLFTALPIGDVAYRMNLMSAIFGALTATLVYGILWLHLRRIVPSVLGALAFAGGYGVWSQAVIAEVYTFNAFLGALILLAAVLWSQSHDHRWLFSMGFLLGLSLGAHGMTFLTLPAFILWFFLNRKREPVVRTLVLSTLCGIVGAMVLWYLPLRALTDPPINWGNPRTWQTFVAHVTARQFDNLLLASSISAFPRRFLTYAVFVYTHFAALSLLLLLGVVVVATCKRKEFLLYALLLLVNSGLFLTFDQPGAYFQLLPSFVVYGLFTGFGGDWLAERVSASLVRWGTLRTWLPVATFALIWMSQVRTTWPDVNLRGNHHPQQDVAEVLREAPRRAVVVAGFDQILFTLWYYRFVEGLRPDLAIEHTGNVEKVMRQYPDRPALCPMFPPRSLPPGYYFEPVGAFGYVRKGVPQLRYIEDAGDRSPRRPYVLQYVTTDHANLRLLSARLRPDFMRREGMSTIYCSWRLDRETRDRLAARYLFKFRRVNRKDRSAAISATDKAVLSANQFEWTQDQPLSEGGSTDNWPPNRVVEGRVPIRPPWRVVAGVYSIQAAIVPSQERTGHGSSPPPKNFSGQDLPSIGEIEVYMQ